APMGGYIAGSKELIEKVSYRLTCPGVGREAGASLDVNRQLYQGLFMAPEIVANAMKTAVFTTNIMTELGFETFPAPDAPRGDIITSVLMKDAQSLIAFCRGVQKGSPIDSFVAPEPWDMPGYDSQVIMAAGTFNNGASIELSADAPLREPYAAYVQGGITYASGRMGILCALQEMYEKGCIKAF
ncbi:MAG: methionine gamma-lyase family protein, partial [Oscillospiraceae bacterium]|nr:methionine gamma-lyase family protein [Oscillospiraceae bacterium]